jgi:hypothetical protein
LIDSWTPSLGRVGWNVTWKNVSEHAAGAFSYWGQGVSGRMPVTVFSDVFAQFTPGVHASTLRHPADLRSACRSQIA